jgi:transposase
MLQAVLEGLPRLAEPRGELMRAPDEVATMVRLKALGWGVRRIAHELGCSHMTVRRYLEAGGWPGYQARQRAKALDGLEDWLAERFRRHRGNADVVRQELEREHGIRVSLRTVERAVQELRRELVAEARATVRFETAPGRQLQIDFGSTFVTIADEPVRVFLFVATLGYSRCNFVAAFRHERQSAWLDGLERAFRHFGGVPEEVLLDNAKPLVTRHDPWTREVVFNDRFHAFARYWGFRPQACAPYRARTKGKDERGVGYVKRNAIAGRYFASWAELDGHLARWMREVADIRIHGTTGEAPLERFRRDEARALKPLPGRPPFRQMREVARRVHADGCIDLDTNRYSVPWRLIGALVTVQVVAGELRVLHGGIEVARHAERRGRRERSIEAAHLIGLVANDFEAGSAPARADPPSYGELLRPLAEYERAVGGGW